MYIRKVLIAIKLALVLLLCFVIVRTVIIPQHPARIFTPVSAVGTENVIENITDNPVKASAEDCSAIVERNIFGGSDSSNLTDLQDNRSDDVIKSGEEELGLALVGTISGSSGVSRAIIKDTKTKQLGLYKTGQNIADARIKSIQENAVILLHNGQRKKLTLNRTGEQNEIYTLPSQITNQTITARAVTPVKQTTTEIPTKIAYLATILSKAVIEHYTVNDQVEGLKITGLDKIPMVKTLGLKNGDVIREVNGNRLTSKQKALQVFKKARSQPAINLELIRNGETKKLSFILQ